MMASCSAKRPKLEGVVRKNLGDILTACDTLENTVKFCQALKLIPEKINCPSCGDFLEKVHQRKKGDTFRLTFRCQKRSCERETSAKKDTWFDKSKLSLKKGLVLTYCFARRFDYENAIFESSGSLFGDTETSRETVADLYSYCREVCVESLFSGDIVKKIGGLNCVVEIDEAKFGKRKYNRGRVVEGQWVLGGICRETKESFFVPVEDRSAETLCGIIEKHVEKGSVLHTDCWRGYAPLAERGYRHLTVNHTEHFVDPDSGACTNTIESTWWAIKRSLPSSHTRKENFGQHLAEYIWRRKKSGCPCIFTELVKEIVKVYPGQ